MEHVMAAVGRLLLRDDGQDLIEYGLLMSLIAIVVMAGITTLGQQINSVLWLTIANNF